MSARKRTTIGVAALLLLLVLITLLLGVSHSRGTGVVLRATPSAVEITPAATHQLTQVVSAVGTVSALNDVVVSSETAGRVTGVSAQVGDRVRAGQTLVTVDNELKAIAVEQAKAQLLAAETQRTKARGDFERGERLFAAGDISTVELETYRLGFRSAEASFAGAQVGLRHAERQLHDTRIASPIGGYVASRLVDVGEMVAPGREIANIVDLSRAKVKLTVREEDIVGVHRGQAAHVTVDARPGHAFAATVLSVGRKAETPGGHSYPVEVVIDSGGAELLKVGMFARVDIRTETRASVLAVSKEALVGDDTDPAVFVAENGFARRRSVTLGLRAGELQEIVSGLRAGEPVITFGHRKLRDGSPVLVTGKEDQ